MKEIIDSLKDIQSDMVGILLPAIITSLVSIFTLLVNSFVKLSIYYRQYNRQQYLIMKKLYPELKVYFINLRLDLSNLEDHNLYISVLESIKIYKEYNDDDSLYRSNNPNKIMHIDRFIELMDSYINKMDALNTYLNNMDFPAISTFHIILKFKIRKMFANLQYTSLVITEYKNGNISGDVLLNEIEYLQSERKYTLDKKTVNKHIKILYKWFAIY